MARHLAIFTPEAVQLIFSGKKKIEGRFSRIKIPPYLKVGAGDTVLIKISGEEIVGQFIVDRVFYFDHPTEVEASAIKKKYSRALALPKSFWLDHEKINYMTLMFIG
ncbi:ASCH domain-containing protein, partial [Candidatus Curtissbacteria bacterium]|nr:ASCH domain-containing protein [Candidatus Curtissbacteria bacterium]